MCRINTTYERFTVQISFERNAEVNAPDFNGSNPFRRVSKAVNANVVKLLLEHNADACDNSGTPQCIWR